LAILPDGRILITQKRGDVMVYKNGSVLAAPLIDLRDRVNDYWDHGLLGIAVDPNL
jgi:glucose/arabinose dehydrogenase